MRNLVVTARKWKFKGIGGGSSILISESFHLIFHIKEKCKLSKDLPQQTFQLIQYCIFLPPRYNWNIVETGVKHHNPNTAMIRQTIANQLF
jgi:hypothetical protein